MAEELQIDSLSEAYTMNGGDGCYSYTKNSKYQKEAIFSAKELIIQAIVERLDIKSLSSLDICRIADLGCSVGPNTFFVVQNIMEAVKSKYKILGLDSYLPEFQVFFSDHSSNDFNTLFTSLPQDRQYYVVGVPGSFYNKLFPDSSLLIVHSSYSIRWISKVPNEVVSKTSSAWNKGKVYYSVPQMQSLRLMQLSIRRTWTDICVIAQKK
ncbi:S-adenosylmethionine-dependent methyltransferase [Quillaja saponaria]|uniref:S-adenosylmethionine-dependent methyltransferase n=1 Tax=Quillaja saponaria TaxID=32244 RepID=A0AAD7Q5D8_QUISA|nr:S-adenosylmethionine-dependent methyltransferase [Quillaja saponaria]